MTTTQHLTIGEFSSLSRISIRMLRHYDEHGLLRPDSVDQATGYRRYLPEQLADAAQIRRLRDVGFSVSAIAAVIATADEEAYRRALTLQRASLLRERDGVEERLVLIDQLIRSKENAMDAITVSHTTVPAARVVALRGVIPTYTDEGLLWQRFMPELGRQSVQPIGPGGVIEHDGEYRESDPDVSVWVPVGADVTVAEPLEIIDLPEQAAVVATIVGPYSLITEAHSRIAEYAQAKGLTLADGGPRAPVGDRNRNRYLTEPGTPGDPVTEVIMPLA